MPDKTAHTPEATIAAIATKAVVERLDYREFVAVYPKDKAALKVAIHRVSAHDELVAALDAMLQAYTQLVSCGDCGNWDPEGDTEVIQARAALANAQPDNKGDSDED